MKTMKLTDTLHTRSNTSGSRPRLSTSSRSSNSRTRINRREAAVGQVDNEEIMVAAEVIEGVGEGEVGQELEVGVEDERW